MAFDHLANGQAVVDHKNQGVFHDFSEICDRPGSAAGRCQQRAHDIGQRGRVNRFGKKCPGSQSQDPPPGLVVQLRTRGDHRDRGQLFRSLDFSQQLESIEPGHLQVGDINR